MVAILPIFHGNTILVNVTRLLLTGYILKRLTTFLLLQPFDVTKQRPAKVHGQPGRQRHDAVADVDAGGQEKSVQVSRRRRSGRKHGRVFVHAEAAATFCQPGKRARRHFPDRHFSG